MPAAMTPSGFLSFHPPWQALRRDCAAAASISACAAINLLMQALSLINVAVLYTLNNGGVLIVSVLWSVVILKEKLGRMKVIGLILAIAAVFALSVL